MPNQNPDSCSTVGNSCCPSGYADLLHVTLIQVTCPAIDGKVADVRFIGTTSTGVGDKYTWQGPVDQGQSLGSCGRLDVTLEIIPSGGCLWSVTIRNAEGGVCLGAGGGHGGGVASCPLTDDAFSGTWNSGNCSCCSGTVIIHVTP
jgi:hypothetical protein